MPNPKRLLDALYGVPMQDGGKPPKRGVSSLPGYGEGIDDPTTQALLAIRRNLGEAGRAAVGVKPYDETNPTETYRAMQALFNAPTPAAIIPEAAQAAGKAAGVLSGLGALGVVKPKGGNWLAGTVERGLKPLRLRSINNTDPAEQLLRLKEKYGSEGAAEVLASGMYPNIKEHAAINNWIDTKLGKYVKNEMATPEDPVRALAERGVLHRAPYELADPNSAIMNKRLSSGMPVKPMGQSQEAQFWENVTDRAIDPARAADFKYGSLDESILQNNPWLEKVPDEAMVYTAKGLSNDLGFNHLIDELRNATNPDSGLPRSLQLSPDKLQKVTVPQAVELVDKINKWRAEQKATADLKRSQNAATVEYKAYDTIPGTTEPNQRGLRWVELRTPEITSADQLTPEAKAKYQWYLTTGVGEEAALRQAAKHDESLAESLKYEGEVMGHCVGGYCPDVQEGRSRIYSLRDKKGEPHVTIEVQPTGYTFKDIRAAVGDDAANEMLERGLDLRAMAKEIGYKPQNQNIVQIKGKANRAPKDEYLPFVQDFVRSGQWSSVGDLGNTGLIRKSDYIDTFTPEMLDSVGVGEYMTKEEFNQLADKLGGINKMAAGGAVSTQNNRKVRISDNLDTMRLELMRAPRMQDGGSVDQFLGRTAPRGVSALPGYGQGKEDVQQALTALEESPIGRIASGAGELAEGYMSGAGSTDLQKIGQGLSMIPMLGLPATIGRVVKTAKIAEPVIDASQTVAKPIQQTVKTAPKSIAEMTAEMAEKGKLNVREPSSLSGQMPSIPTPHNIQPITTVQLPSGQFATTTGFSTVKPIKTGFEVAETPEQVAHLTAGLRKSPQEQLVAVVVDENNKPIQIIRHTVGLINESSAEPFSLVGSIANTPGAKGFYISHNHPSGITELSPADQRLADYLNNLTKDTGLQMRGILAVGKNKFGYYDPISKVSTQDQAIPPAIRNKSINMVERILKKSQLLDDVRLDSPQVATRFADKFAGDQTGILLLNNQQYPVGFLPIDPSQFTNLRKSGASTNILKALEKTNSNKGVLITKSNIKPDELENIEKFFNASSVRLLDAIVGNKRDSAALKGNIGRTRSTDFLSVAPVAAGLGAAVAQEDEYKKGGRVHISNNPDTMRLELLRKKHA